MSACQYTRFESKKCSGQLDTFEKTKSQKDTEAFKAKACQMLVFDTKRMWRARTSRRTENSYTGNSYENHIDSKADGGSPRSNFGT